MIMLIYVVRKAWQPCRLRSTTILGVFRRYLLQSYPFQSNLRCLGSIIRLGHLLEPWMVQGLLRCNSLTRVIYEDFLQKIQEVLQENIARRNDVLFHSQYRSKIWVGSQPTLKCFMALTKRLEPLVVSGVG